MPPERKPVLCYVTDRRAFHLAHSTGPEIDGSSFDALRVAIRGSAMAGVNWIQIREKDLAGGALARLVQTVIADTLGMGTRILVNDRLDVAIAAKAAGVHLGENSLPLEAVVEWRRNSGRIGFQIGVSCHSLEAARSAESGGADYIFFGPVFATPSKAAFGQPQGIGRLREVCGAVRIPVIAIGGIDFQNARACINTGAAGIAAIRLFQDGVDAEEMVRGFK